MAFEINFFLDYLLTALYNEILNKLRKCFQNSVQYVIIISVKMIKRKVYYFHTFLTTVF